VLETDYGTPPYKPFIEDLTIEHLLTHTGGWPNDARDPMFSHPQMNLAELISWTIDNAPLTTMPGKGEQTSIDKIVERLEGKVPQAVAGEPDQPFEHKIIFVKPPPRNE
jgi:hypothetical protein